MPTLNTVITEQWVDFSNLTTGRSEFCGAAGWPADIKGSVAKRLFTTEDARHFNGAGYAEAELCTNGP